MAAVPATSAAGAVGVGLPVAYCDSRRVGCVPHVEIAWFPDDSSGWEHHGHVAYHRQGVGDCPGARHVDVSHCPFLVFWRVDGCVPSPAFLVCVLLVWFGGCYGYRVGCEC